MKRTSANSAFVSPELNRNKRPRENTTDDDNVNLIENGGRGSSHTNESNTGQLTNITQYNEENEHAVSIPNGSSNTFLEEENFHKYEKKIKELAKKDPFSPRCQTKFLNDCQELQQYQHKNENEGANLTKAAYVLMGAGTIYGAQVDNMYSTVHEFVRNNCTKKKSPNDAVGTVRHENEVESTGQANIPAEIDQCNAETSLQESANNQNGDAAEQNEISHNEFDDTTYQQFASISNLELHGQDLENEHQDTEHSLQHMDLTDHETRSHDAEELESNGTPTFNPEHHETNGSGINGINEHGERNSNESGLSLDVGGSHQLVASTPIRSVLDGPCAGTRKIDNTALFRNTYLDVIALVGSPSHARHADSTRRNLFGGATNATEQNNATHTSDDTGIGSGELNENHHNQDISVTSLLAIGDQDTDVLSVHEVAQDMNYFEHVPQHPFLDCLRALFQNETAEPTDILASFLRTQDISESHGRRLFSDNDNGSYVNWKNIPFPPPTTNCSQVFRAICNPDNNIGPSIMDQATEKNRKDSLRKLRSMSNMYLIKVAPILEEYRLRSAIYNCSAMFAKNVTAFHTQMKNVFTNMAMVPPFQMSVYQMDMLNIANSPNSSSAQKQDEDLETQESGYASQQTQEIQQENLFKFEDLIPLQIDKPPTRADITRFFCATMKLLSDNDMKAFFDPVRDEEVQEEEYGEPIPSSSQNLPPLRPAKQLQQDYVDIRHVNFKALKTVSTTEEFRRHEAENAAVNSETPSQESDAENNEVFVQAAEAHYGGELFSRRSRQLQENRKMREFN